MSDTPAIKVKSGSAEYYRLRYANDEKYREAHKAICRLGYKRKTKDCTECKKRLDKNANFDRCFDCRHRLPQMWEIDPP